MSLSVIDVLQDLSTNAVEKYIGEEHPMVGAYSTTLMYFFIIFYFAEALVPVVLRYALRGPVLAVYNDYGINPDYTIGWDLLAWGNFAIYIIPALVSAILLGLGTVFSVLLAAITLGVPIAFLIAQIVMFVNASSFWDASEDENFAIDSNTPLYEMATFTSITVVLGSTLYIIFFLP